MNIWRIWDILYTYVVKGSDATTTPTNALNWVMWPSVSVSRIYAHSRFSQFTWASQKKHKDTLFTHFSSIPTGIEVRSFHWHSFHDLHTSLNYYYNSIYSNSKLLWYVLLIQRSKRDLVCWLKITYHDFVYWSCWLFRFGCILIELLINQYSNL